MYLSRNINIVLTIEPHTHWRGRGGEGIGFAGGPGRVDAGCVDADKFIVAPLCVTSSLGGPLGLVDRHPHVALSGGFCTAWGDKDMGGGVGV